MMQGKADLICIEADFYFIKRAKSFFYCLTNQNACKKAGKSSFL